MLVWPALSLTEALLGIICWVGATPFSLVVVRFYAFALSDFSLEQREPSAAATLAQTGALVVRCRLVVAAPLLSGAPDQHGGGLAGGDMWRGRRQSLRRAALSYQMASCLRSFFVSLLLSLLLFVDTRPCGSRLTRCELACVVLRVQVTIFRVRAHVLRGRTAHSLVARPRHRARRMRKQHVVRSRIAIISVPPHCRLLPVWRRVCNDLGFR